MKMGLFADAIRFPEPRCDFIVDFADALEAKGMKMIARRESFDPAKARMFETPREDDMAIHPVLSNDERGKTHPHLKRDPGFLGTTVTGPFFFATANSLSKMARTLFGFLAK